VRPRRPTARRSARRPVRRWRRELAQQSAGSPGSGVALTTSATPSCPISHRSSPSPMPTCTGTEMGPPLATAAAKVLGGGERHGVSWSVLVQRHGPWWSSRLPCAPHQGCMASSARRLNPCAAAAVGGGRSSHRASDEDADEPGHNSDASRGSRTVAGPLRQETPIRRRGCVKLDSLRKRGAVPVGVSRRE
jgi:hypothetical protein